MTATDVEVRLLETTGSDAGVAAAARISTEAEGALTDDREISGLISYLMRYRHGSPFEHNLFRFYVKAPIFVFREFHRHRIGFSYNEMSGRYMQLPNEFYVPGPDRPLVQVGNSAHPRLAPGPEGLWEWFTEDLEEGYREQWARYQRALDRGIANEVARMHLPVGIMSQMVVTCNARSLMSFLSLRTDEPDATFPSKPLWEIDRLVARVMEGVFAEAMPITHDAFVRLGRVAP